MTLNPEDLRTGLPAYLTAADQAALSKGLRDFMQSQRLHGFYYATRDPEPLQGDVWGRIDVFNFETGERKHVRAMLVSNSCDISAGNVRYLQPRLTVATVVPLAAYEQLLLTNGLTQQRVADHLQQVRAQMVTQLFYLPPGAALQTEHVALLQDLHSLPVEAMVAQPSKPRLASLSQFGFYLLLFKLSVHFCRFLEGVDRGQEGLQAVR
jgi:hypothetical protein